MLLPTPSSLPYLNVRINESNPAVYKCYSLLLCYSIHRTAENYPTTQTQTLAQSTNSLHSHFYNWIHTKTLSWSHTFLSLPERIHQSFEFLIAASGQDTVAPHPHLETNKADRSYGRMTVTPNHKPCIILRSTMI